VIEESDEAPFVTTLTAKRVGTCDGPMGILMDVLPLCFVQRMSESAANKLDGISMSTWSPNE
jgi:hypothetical protein